MTSFFRSSTVIFALSASVLGGCGDDDKAAPLGATSPSSGGNGGAAAGQGGGTQAGQGGVTQAGQGGVASGVAGQAGAPAACLAQTTKPSPTAQLSFEPWACDLPALCDDVGFSPYAFGSSPPSTGAPTELAYEKDPAATGCFFEALRAGKKGKLTLSWRNGGVADYGRDVTATLYLLGDGYVLYEAIESIGCCGQSVGYKSARLQLKDPAYFETCLAVSSVAARAMCALGITSTASEMFPEDGIPPWSTGSCDEQSAACP